MACGELVMTMVPAPRAHIEVIASRPSKKTPVRLIARTRFHSSTLVWRTSLVHSTPADTKTTSGGPTVSCTHSKVAVTSDSLATSQWRKTTRGPSARSDAASCSPSSSATSLTTTRAPARAKARAEAAPIPVDPPPTITTWSMKKSSHIISPLSFVHGGDDRAAQSLHHVVIVALIHDVGRHVEVLAHFEDRNAWVIL